MLPGIYRHYKGPLYRVFGVATHTETKEIVVVYQALYGDYSWWIRPLEMFKENVMYEGKERARFTYEATLSADAYLPIQKEPNT